MKTSRRGFFRHAVQASLGAYVGSSLFGTAVAGTLDLPLNRFAFADALLGITTMCRTATSPPHAIEAIHQILIVDGLKETKQLNHNVAKNIDAVKTLYPTAKHTLWHGEALRELIGNNFDSAVLKSFDRLRPYAFKADLAKYCLLHHYGGLYIDVGLNARCRLNIPTSYGLAAFLHPKPRCSWLDMSSSLMWACPGRREMTKTIDKIVENCRQRFYGFNPGNITGSTPFGLSCAETMIEQWQDAQPQDQWIGERRRATINGIRKSVFLAKDGSLVAIRRADGGGDWSSIATSGVNNYSEMWHRKQVYTD